MILHEQLPNEWTRLYYFALDYKDGIVKRGSLGWIVDSLGIGEGRWQSRSIARFISFLFLFSTALTFFVAMRNVDESFKGRFLLLILIVSGPVHGRRMRHGFH